jgi:two-component system sensor histidine kinase YesM
MKNLFKTYRLDYLFFGIFAGFIIVLLLVFTRVAYNISSQELERNTSFYQEALLDELNKELTIQLNAIEQVTLSTASNPYLLDYLTSAGDDYARNKNFDDTQKMLSYITYSNAILNSVQLYADNPVKTEDPQGVVHFYDMKKLATEQWYPNVQNTDAAWIGEHIIATSQGNVPVISFSRKILVNTYDYKGLLVFNIKATALKEILEGEAGAKNRLLLDSGGRLITETGNGTLLPRNQLDEYITKMNGTNGNIRIPAKYGEEGSLLVWSRLFNSNWILIEITPLKQITKGSFRLAEVLTLLGASAVLASLFFTLTLSRQFVKPIRLLVGVMRRYTLGERSEPLPNDYKNEFGYLFIGYHSLTERIEELYKSLRERHRRQREAEIQALQANINPHFLYNTLDQLNWIAIQAGQEKISHILELIGKMFRISLSNGQSFILMEDELAHVECYLQIQQIRWGDGLEYVIDIPDELKNLYLPKITLQPFVENAIIHGFHGRIGGKVDICARRSGEDLVVTVCDNGIGIQSDWKTTKIRKTGGYGIRNVKERIEALFGSAYGIELVGLKEGGTIATIRIPVLEQAPESCHTD